MQSGDGDYAYYVADRASSRKVVDWFRESLTDRSYRFGVAETLNEFVADIAGLEVGEDKNIGATRDAALGSFELADVRHERGVELELAVNEEVGMKLVEHFGGVNDLLHVGMMGAAILREVP